MTAKKKEQFLHGAQMRYWKVKDGKIFKLRTVLIQLLKVNVTDLSPMSCTEVSVQVNCTVDEFGVVKRACDSEPRELRTPIDCAKGECCLSDCAWIGVLKFGSVNLHLHIIQNFKTFFKKI